MSRTPCNIIVPPRRVRLQQAEAALTASLPYANTRPSGVPGELLFGSSLMLRAIDRESTDPVSLPLSYVQTPDGILHASPKLAAEWLAARAILKGL